MLPTLACLAESVEVARESVNCAESQARSECYLDSEITDRTPWTVVSATQGVFAGNHTLCAP